MPTKNCGHKPGTKYRIRSNMLYGLTSCQDRPSGWVPKIRVDRSWRGLLEYLYILNGGGRGDMQTATAGDAQRDSIIREHLGPFSLGVALAGFGITELALTMKWIGGPTSRVVAGAFEAATVGGMADWFAIRALFREMKIPIIKIPIPHTNIIIKNRKKISDGIVDLVENRLLTPSAIKERLQDFSPSRHLLERDQEQGEWMELILPILRNLLGDVVEALSAEKSITYMQEFFGTVYVP